jgi:hypothetical protein
VDDANRCPSLRDRRGDRRGLFPATREHQERALRVAHLDNQTRPCREVGVRWVAEDDVDRKAGEVLLEELGPNRNDILWLRLDQDRRLLDRVEQWRFITLLRQREQHPSVTSTDVHDGLRVGGNLGGDGPDHPICGRIPLEVLLGLLHSREKCRKRRRHDALRASAACNSCNADPRMRSASQLTKPVSGKAAVRCARRSVTSVIWRARNSGSLA